MIQLENHHQETRLMQPGLKAQAKVPTQVWINPPWSKANVSSLAMHLDYVFSTIIYLLSSRRKFICRLVILNNG